MTRDISSDAMNSFAELSPVDGAKLDLVVPTSLQELPAMVERAKQAQRAWAGLAVAERARAFSNVRDHVMDRGEELASLIHREVGKPEAEALLGEVLATGDVLSFWIEHIEEHLEDLELEIDPISYPSKRGRIIREPRGVLGVIMPWNFPLALPFRTLVPALLAGNAVIFKPSEISPRTGALVVELFRGLPEGVLQLLQGGGEHGAALCSSGVDLVVFTGSVATGRKVAHACAERLIPCSLELGGKDAAIVLADANLDRAAHGIVWGALMNAGQNCGAVERVYVERKVADAFTQKVVEIAKELRPGIDVGPLTTKAQCEIVRDHVEDAKAQGAEVLLGGNSAVGGYEYPVTIARVERDDVRLIADETFGPVLPILVVETAEEAVARANASRYGLTASIWTKNYTLAKKLGAQIRAGVVTINNHSFTGALANAPWTGVGESGYGVTNSIHALEAYTRPKLYLEDRNSQKRELWWFPYTPHLKTIALSFLVLRSGTKSVFVKMGAVFRLLGAFLKRWKT